MAVKNSKTCYLEDNIINLKDINGVDHKLVIKNIFDGYDQVYFDVQQYRYYLYYHANTIWESEEERMFEISEDTYNEVVKLIEEVTGDK